jgi:hypothetical protein
MSMMVEFPPGNGDGTSPLIAGDPSAAQDAVGNFYVAALWADGTLHTKIRAPLTGIWTALHSDATQYQGVPSVAVTANGDVWVAARDASNVYQLLRYPSGSLDGTLATAGGQFETDPVLAACPDGSVFMVGKNVFNTLVSLHYVPGSGSQGFVAGGGVVQGKPAIMCAADNAAYIASRDFTSSIWVARVSGNTWTGWWNGGAVSSIDPRLVPLGGSMGVVILDYGGSVFRSTFVQGAGNGWQGWTNVGGVLGDMAAVGISGELYFLGRDSSSHLWWWQQTGNAWTHIGRAGEVAGKLAGAN